MCINFAAPVESLEIVEDIDRVGRRASCDGAGDISSLQGTTRSPGELPLYQETKEPERADNLNEVSSICNKFLSGKLSLKYLVRTVMHYRLCSLSQ